MRRNSDTHTRVRGRGHRPESPGGVDAASAPAAPSRRAPRGSEPPQAPVCVIARFPPAKCPSPQPAAASLDLQMSPAPAVCVSRPASASAPVSPRVFGTAGLSARRCAASVTCGCECASRTRGATGAPPVRREHIARHTRSAYAHTHMNRTQAQAGAEGSSYTQELHIQPHTRLTHGHKGS